MSTPTRSVGAAGAPTGWGADLLDHLVSRAGPTDPDDTPLVHAVEIPARAASVADWPEWAPGTVVRALRDRGIVRPYTHQVATAEAAHAGRDVVVATGTASGKSLGYQLPVLSALVDDPRATALYLSPTKALGADQLHAAVDLCREVGVDDVHPCPYDGDTSTELRHWARAHSRWVFTNPDMLHAAFLPGHERWGRLLRHLRYVVVDECHAYRGVFGSHVALVLRRLRRLARRHGADPVFVLASATTGEPGVAARRLVGRPCDEVTDDGSPHGPRTIAFWEPPLLDGVVGEHGAPVRQSAGAQAASMLADLVGEGARTLAFVRSRHGAEITAMDARHRVSQIDAALAERIGSYRAGYLAEDRRDVESRLDDGRLLGVATTNALELGVDIAGLDAVVMAGFPGTVASFWQQAGRCGRRGAGSLAVLIARDDPLDTYLVHHPAAILDTPVEATVTDPTNPYVLGPHLLCAALENPLSDDELDDWGATALAHELEDDDLLRRRPTGWFAAPDTHPHGEVEIRGGIGGQVAVLDTDTGQVLGTVDGGRAPATVHTGAVHLHQGRTYVVEQLLLDEGIAWVRREDPGWSTLARSTTDISIHEMLSLRELGSVTVGFADIDVTEQVVGYLRRLPGGEVIDHVPLDLPPHTLPSRGAVLTIDEDALSRAGIGADRVPGALHAAEHAAIGLLPLVATCDRGDLGGVSTALHPDTGCPTIVVYDGHPGGAGFAERGVESVVRWLTATRDAVAACRCTTGCPSCVQSPKCGNGNDPLDKAGAVVVLDLLLDALADEANRP